MAFVPSGAIFKPLTKHIENSSYADDGNVKPIKCKWEKVLELDKKKINKLGKIKWIKNYAYYPDACKDCGVDEGLGGVGVGADGDGGGGGDGGGAYFPAKSQRKHIIRKRLRAENEVDEHVRSAQTT